MWIFKLSVVEKMNPHCPVSTGFPSSFFFRILTYSDSWDQTGIEMNLSDLEWRTLFHQDIDLNAYLVKELSFESYSLYRGYVDPGKVELQICQASLLIRVPRPPARRRVVRCCPQRIGTKGLSSRPRQQLA